MTGGNFANGAVTAAFQYAFNQAMSGSAQKRGCSGRPCGNRPQGEGGGFAEDLYNSTKENLKFGTTAKAVYGVGGGTSSIFTIDGIAEGDSTLLLIMPEGR